MVQTTNRHQDYRTVVLQTMVFMQNNNFQNVSSHTKCQWLYNKYKCRWQYVLCKPQSEVVRSGKKRQEYISVIHILQAADVIPHPLSSTHTHSLTIPSILPTTSQHTHMHMHLFYMQITLQSEPYCLAQFFQDLHIFFLPILYLRSELCIEKMIKGC